MALAVMAGHSGGLNAEGCHTNRRTGDYHCHRGGQTQRPAQRLQGLRSGPGATGRSYSNCSEARAAGAAPVRAGDPGYGPHLERFLI